MSVKGEVSNFMPDYYKGVYEMEKLLEAEDFILGGYVNFAVYFISADVEVE